jgi:phosphoglycolate phosphatase
MRKEVDLLMFDLDGTLADTGRDLADAVNHVRSHLNLEPLENQIIYGQVGRGVEHLLRSSVPQEFQSRFKELLDVFLNRYEDHLLDSTVLYPHVKETLAYFRDKRRAVVSNKLHRFAVSVLRGLSIEGSFDAILGGDTVAQRKPHPEPLIQMLRSFGIQPTRAVIVGDGGIDIEAGKGAGVWTCGVTYGLGKREELLEAKPDVVVNELRELTQYFC